MQLKFEEGLFCKLTQIVFAKKLLSHECEQEDDKAQLKHQTT